MRVLIVSDYFYPHWTGIAKAMLNLVRALAPQIDFTVSTVRFRSDLPAEERIAGARVVRSPAILRLSRTYLSPAMLRDLARLIPAHDAVLINSPCTVILPAALLCRYHKKPFAIFHQGDLNLGAGPVNRLIEKAFDVCTHFACRRAKQVSTYTRDYAERSRILEPYLDKCSPLLMPFLLEPAGAEDVPTLDELRRLKDRGKVLFGFAGRFVDEKGFDLLFRAIPMVLKELPQAMFVFAGETNMVYERSYEKTGVLRGPIEDNLLSLGLLDAQALRRFYELIDFIVLPSRSDCFPLVQAEACLLGRPSIATDIPGLRVVVKETGFGVLAQPESPEDLARAILRAWSERAQIAEKKAAAAAFLSPETAAKKLEAFFRALAQESP